MKRLTISGITNGTNTFRIDEWGRDDCGWESTYGMDTDRSV
ncbi:hypothetical protein [Halocatena salina]|nr:hypothetical protein [Halocatena salina]